MVSVVLNKWAFAAVKLDGSVVMWGHKSYGGSKIPPLNSDYWDPADIHSVVPDTLVATCCAFGFIRNVRLRLDVFPVVDFLAVGRPMRPSSGWSWCCLGA